MAAAVAAAVVVVVVCSCECRDVAEVVVDGLGVVALECSGEALDTVVVGCGLLFWCGQCGGEVT